jgi:uncharacterized repeat protein (TIGR03803 family)
MLSKRSLVLVGAALSVAFGFSTLTAPVFAASKEQVLRRFNGTDGYRPNGALVFDASGNLYGTTSQGGAYYGGNVFRLTASNGKWIETELFSFCPSRKYCTGGIFPSAGVIFDASGKNLYGTTGNGGRYGGGAVFELTPGADGKWTEKVLHSFGKGEDGNLPQGGLTLDAAGNLYGTTYYGGANSKTCAPVSCGTVFQLKPGSNGEWIEKVLHNFSDDGKDGFWPETGLTVDPSGNIYGTTHAGGVYPCPKGASGCGIVFRLSPSAGGKWTETILHSFNGNDGQSPAGNVIFDAQGNLYGTTYFGGEVGCDYPYGCGTVFELTPGTNGGWTEKVLWSFSFVTIYQMRGPSGVILDAAGNLYGLTWYGGRYNTDACSPGCGTAFELSLGENGMWTERTLHSFGKGRDGNEPLGTLIFDGAGNLYGVTYEGGINSDNCLAGGCGTVFEITP